MKRTLLIGLLALLASSSATGIAAAASRARVRDIAIHDGDVPKRLMGYGLVVGLDGTGDRSLGGVGSPSATVRSVVNLLRRFGLVVPPEYLRLRNVAAALVTAEISPYLRAGGRFDVQVSALGDATSLEGGVLWMTPLTTDADQPPSATAQGPVMVSSAEKSYSLLARRNNSARIPDGGVLEVDGPPPASAAPRLLLREPDRTSARQIAEAINAALGEGTATVEDPGSIRLQPANGGSALDLLAAVDTVAVDLDSPARIVIYAKDGTVVAGGEIRVGPATIHHHGIALQIGGGEASGSSTPGLVRAAPESLVQDVAAGLHAAGATPEEIAAIFDALRAAGALRAVVEMR
jgi:flagellar P-ring protein precursor FlgI